MASFEMQLNRHGVDDELVFDDGIYHGVYVLTGTLTINQISYVRGSALFQHGHATAIGPATILHFTVAPPGIVSPSGEPILHQSFEWPGGESVLRLDRVNFPPGARAYRHIHPGPGIRTLIGGSLEIASDHETTQFEAGQAWFEEANSPVQATAAQVSDTAFIRMMVLPSAYHGKPTLRLLNAEDEARPRLQTNERFFDEMIVL